MTPDRVNTFYAINPRSCLLSLQLQGQRDYASLRLLFSSKAVLIYKPVDMSDIYLNA